MIENEIFKKYKPSYEKLIKYGFVKEGDVYHYEKNFMNGDFKVVVKIDKDQVHGRVIDAFSNEEYLLLRVKDISNYALEVKNRYEDILKDILKHCFIITPFISNQANRLVSFVKDEFNEEVDFPFSDEKIKSSGVFRSKLNNKWYGLIMNIQGIKLDKNIKGNIDVLNVKIPEDKLNDYLKKDGIYECYHMNKKKWVTVILNDTLSDEYVFDLLRQSRYLVVGNKSSNNWIVPANSSYFDVESYIDDSDVFIWKQSKNINENDNVYIYLSSPYSCILYRCKVVKNNIAYNMHGIKLAMKLKTLKKYDKESYDFNYLKKFGITSIRSARRLPLDFVKVIESDL